MANKFNLGKKVHKRKSKTGLPPGSHVYTGKNITEAPIIEVFQFDVATCEKIITDVQGVLALPEDKKLWINVNGINDVEVVKQISEKYSLDPLYQEDILNVFQRTKIEEENSYIYLTFKSLEWNEQLFEIEEEQISLVLTKNAIITFQEKIGDNFDVLRSKLSTSTSTIRGKGLDYLFYRILDVTVDSYFDILEKLGDFIEDMESAMSSTSNKNMLQKIQASKAAINLMRRNIYPMRDLLNKLVTTDHELLDESSKRYFKDVLDHSIQILENIETYRDITVGLKDLYFNTVSHEMNLVMKTLTIISTLFIPLTFIVGVYGMNFRVMPELEWPNGYYLVWAFMLSIAIGLIIWFRRKGWF